MSLGLLSPLIRPDSIRTISSSSALPAQQVGLRTRLRNAIANSATTILWSSVIGAAVKNFHLEQHGFGVGRSLLLAAFLIPSAMVTSWFTGARVHRWPVHVIRLAFIVLLLCSGVRVFLAGWGQVQQRSPIRAALCEGGVSRETEPHRGERHRRDTRRRPTFNAGSPT